MSTPVRRIVAVFSGLVLFVAGAATSVALRQDAASAERAPVQLPRVPARGVPQPRERSRHDAAVPR